MASVCDTGIWPGCHLDSQSSCCCAGCVWQLCVMGSAEVTHCLSNSSRTTSSAASIRRYFFLLLAIKSLGVCVV